MRIYIAARFSKRHIAHSLAKELQKKGHTITSRWVLPDNDHVLPVGISKQAEDSERKRFAVEDIADVEECDWCISIMEEPRNDGRGGRHVEFGYALALKKYLTIIGTRETVFHHLNEVEHFDTIDEFLLSLNNSCQLEITMIDCIFTFELELGETYE